MTDTTLLTWDPEGVEAWAKRASHGSAVLMYSLRGFIDAGRAGLLVADHVLHHSEPVRVATFDMDQLLDYRSRRPEMTFSINEWTNYDEPHLELDMVTDAEGTAFLLLHGFEPDVQWERYIRAVREIVDKLGVGLTLGTHGVPMGAPHTRPLTATVHGTRQELLPDSPAMFGTVQVPASSQNLMEYRFGEWGLDAIGVAVHVPHYLAQSSYPQAAQRAMRTIEDVSGLVLSTGDLDEAAATATEEINRQMADSEEIQGLVEQLERQYDALAESREGVIPMDGSLPSADELGAAFEQFLEEQRPDFPPNQ